MAAEIGVEAGCPSAAVENENGKRTSRRVKSPYNKYPLMSTDFRGIRTKSEKHRAFIRILGISKFCDSRKVEISVIKMWRIFLYKQQVHI